MAWWGRAARTLYSGGWVANVVVGVLFALIMPVLNRLLMLNPLLNLLGACFLILWVLGWVVVRSWRDEPTRGAAPLQLRAEVLAGGADIIGEMSTDGRRSTNWAVWLELTLTPAERITATIPIHQITGVLTIGGIQSDGFVDSALETAYTTPPDILRILDNRRNEHARYLPVTQPMGVLLVAYCQTPVWEPAHQPQDDDHLRILLTIAEADYQTLEIVARLHHRGSRDSFTWYVQPHGE